MASPAGAENADAGNAHSAWMSIIEQLHKLKSFRIHTGNINNYVELKLKRFTNSAEELIECLNLLKRNLSPDAQIKENGMLLLADNKNCENIYERDDLKITLKLFMQNFDFSYVKEATESVLQQLQTDSIEQLILAFPVPENHGDHSPVINEKWFHQVCQIWDEAEADLVSKGMVLNMGVADLQLAELSCLYDHAKVKPRVVHVSIEACCMVSPDLQNFAQEHSIQLLTHNDPRPFPLREVFDTFCNKASKVDSGQTPICTALFQPVWAARYTVWVRRRSLMAGKGFIVQFVSTSA